MPRRRKSGQSNVPAAGYSALVSGIAGLLEEARRLAARAVNRLLTATYWDVGRRIVEFEQMGEQRAEYGEQLIRRLAQDLTARFGRGFGAVNLSLMRRFYLAWPSGRILQTLSEKLEPVPAAPPAVPDFPLPWSHYVRLLSVENAQARAFYEAEAVRGGWSVRQLDRQIATQFFERVRASRQPEALRAKGQVARAEDAVTPDEEVRDPYLLEFLNLKDEYSEEELEEALIRHLEWFMLELGTGLAFVARQKRILIDHIWHRMDLVFFHRLLRCLLILDLKVGEFSASDAGQMNLYLNYAKEHLAMPGEADPVGIILCSEKNDAVVRYATGGIQAKVFASRYLTSLPDAETLRQELLRTKRAIETRAAAARELPLLPPPTADEAPHPGAKPERRGASGEPAG